MKSKSIDNNMKYKKYLTLQKKKRKPLSTGNLFPFQGIVSMDAHCRNECVLVTISAHV